MKKILLLTVLSFALFLAKAQIAEIVEYTPAPGQFVNTSGFGTPNAAQNIVNNNQKLVTLGFWGGYIIVGFDHPIENDPNNPYGVDFTVFGNPNYGSSEPGIVQVMKDENKNGLPDDTWYELMGSDHHLSSTKYNYSITYTNPHGKLEYHWIDNEGNHGVVNYESVKGFHPQEFYPSLDNFPHIDQTSYTLHGTLLKHRTTYFPGFWQNWRFDYGYVDNNIKTNDKTINAPDNPYTLDISEGSGGDAFDIDWAIDSNGNSVDLDEISWIKVYNGISLNAGWLGEISTEINGITDVDPNASIQGETHFIVSNHPSHEPRTNNLLWHTGRDFQFESYILDKGRKIYPNQQANQKIIWESDDESVATITNEGLFSPVSEGTVHITATYADDNSISREFEIKIDPDAAPKVANPAPDISVKEDAPDYVVALRDIFDDWDDENDAITKIVKSNSNPTLVSTSIANRGLILSFAPHQTGEATIVVEATSNGKTVTDEFKVTVIPDAADPTVANAIADITTSEDATIPFINLTNVFDDADDENAGIVKTIQSNSNENLLSTTINGNKLIINLKENQSGNATIVVLANSNGKTVSDEFKVIVKAVDDAPTVANAIADITADENATIADIDLSNVFDDVDNDNSLIVKGIQSNSNENLLSTTINGNKLSINLKENQSGNATIVVLATSNGKTVTDEFKVIVKAVDDAPTVSNVIADITANEDATIADIDLSNVFDDVDNDNSLIEKTIQSNSNENLLTASITGNILSIVLNENQSGSATIVVLATSNGKSVTDEFKVTVKAGGSTGISMIDAENFEFYPNPSNGIFRIKTDKGAKFALRIFNMQGKLIYSEANCEGKIDISNQPAGVYMAQIKQGNLLITRKINIK